MRPPSKLRLAAGVLLLCSSTAAAQAPKDPACYPVIPGMPCRARFFYVPPGGTVSAQPIFVTGGVTTTIRLPLEPDLRQTVMPGRRGRFEFGVVGRSVVITPAADLAPGEHFSVTVALADRTLIPLTVVAPPEGKRTDGIVNVYFEKGSIEMLREEIAGLKEQLAIMSANYAQVYGEAISPDHALAGMLAAGRADMTSFFLANKRSFQIGGVWGRFQVFLPGNTREPESTKVALVVELINPAGAPPWEPMYAQIDPALDDRSQQVSWVRPEAPIAVRALPRVIPPGRKGCIALVFDRASAGLGEDDGSAKLVKILGGGHTEFAVELTPSDLQDSRGAFEKWWSR